jgi:hypothetical protein
MHAFSGTRIYDLSNQVAADDALERTAPGIAPRVITYLNA